MEENGHFRNWVVGKTHYLGGSIWRGRGRRVGGIRCIGTTRLSSHWCTHRINHYSDIAWQLTLILYTFNGGNPNHPRQDRTQRLTDHQTRYIDPPINQIILLLPVQLPPRLIPPILHPTRTPPCLIQQKICSIPSRCLTHRQSTQPNLFSWHQTERQTDGHRQLRENHTEIRWQSDISTIKDGSPGDQLQISTK